MFGGSIVIATDCTYVLISTCKTWTSLVEGFVVYNLTDNEKCMCSIFGVIYITMHGGHASRMRRQYRGKTYHTSIQFETCLRQDKLDEV